MITASDFRNIVLNAKQPIVVKNSNTLQWPCLSMQFQEWAQYFDAEKPTSAFDVGAHKFGSTAQFECFRSTKTMKMTEFLSKCDDEFWCCHNYKYLKDCPQLCRQGISFADLGFPEIGDDISFWVGKKGSHTPAHYDAYGCNIVVQAFGRKSWLLFPKKSLATKESRIPYEESSIYCTSNFYSPNPEHLSEFSDMLDRAFHVILEPGDILIVPPKWWHYVECLEDSLNFNTWIKLNSDVDEQISECITRIYVKNYIKDLDLETVHLLLNPNEKHLTDEPIQDLQDTLKYLLNLKSSGKKLSQHSNNYLTDVEFDRLLDKYPNFVLKITPLKDFEFYELLKTNSNRFTTNDERCQFFEKLLKDHKCLNVALHSETIRLIKMSMVD